MSITHLTEFCGISGTSQGTDAAPEVETIAGANHNKDACDSFQLNFPAARVFQEDVTKLPPELLPWCHLYTASPACPPWTTASGVRRDFDKVNSQQTIFGDPDTDDEDDPKAAKRRAEYRRARLLMNEVIRYLRAQAAKGRPVPIGFMENVTQCRLWSEWPRWIGEIWALGYDTRTIAFNSMHAQDTKMPTPPQSRNRLYVAFWHRSLGRTPNWDKWLRPRAFCERCGQVVDSIQVFKNLGVDMGDYGEQYIYQCPNSYCRTEVFPPTRSALAIINTAKPGVRIGDRAARRMRPLVDNTIDRLMAGVREQWLPLLLPVGGTWRAGKGTGARRLDLPLPARTTRECDGIAVPPLPADVLASGWGRIGGGIPAQPAAPTGGLDLPGLLPFITPLRGGGSKGVALPTTRPFGTFTASGNHHGVAFPPHLDPAAMTDWARALLLPYNGNAGPARMTHAAPMGSLTTRDRFGLARVEDADFAAWERELGDISDSRLRDLIDDVWFRMLDDVWFRMLDEEEVRDGMGFRTNTLYSVRSRKAKVRLLGNAVTPAVAELLTCALVECLTGETLERDRSVAA